MRFVKIAILLTLSLSSIAQNQLGIFIEPSFQISSLAGFNSPTYDSLEAIWKNDKHLNFGISSKHNFDRFTSLTTKLGYHTFGFMLLREDLQLFDMIHPAIGKVNDLFQGPSKKAFMHHRFHYLGLSFEYQKDISPVPNTLPIDINAGIGLSYYKLISQDLKLQTEAFAIDGEFTHIITDQLYFKATKNIVSVYGLLEAIYHPKETWDVYGQLQVEAPFMYMTEGEAEVYVFTPALQIGLRKTL